MFEKSEVHNSKLSKDVEDLKKQVTAMRRKNFNLVATNGALTKRIEPLEQLIEMNTTELGDKESKIIDQEARIQQLIVDVQNVKAEKEAASQELAQLKRVKTEEDMALSKLQEYQKWMSSMPDPIWGTLNDDKEIL